MVSPHTLLLSAIVFLPALGALLLAFVPKDKVDIIRYLTLAVTALVLIVCVWGFLISSDTQFDMAADGIQGAFDVDLNIDWIPSFDIYYIMGFDGISFPLVILTAFVSLLAMGASWSIKKHVKGYCILFLLLEMGMLGVFLSLDFFLFYVFWEVMLLPMYFLIGVWGGPRREYAAIKFFLFTLVGSVLMLIAILMLYFNSDMRKLADETNVYGDNPSATVNWDELRIAPRVKQRLQNEGQKTIILEDGSGLSIVRSGVDADKPLSIKLERADAEETVALFGNVSEAIIVRVASDKGSAADVAAAIRANPATNNRVHIVDVEENSDAATLPFDESAEIPTADKIHTFGLLPLAAMGQHTDSFSRKLQVWSFLLLFIGFAIKVPSVPFHTWLPDAHVEAPTPISMILAGVLLKMGGYGIIRICYPICPFGGYDLMYFVCTVGVVSMVYGGFAAMAQKDFKRLVAYSSISHMGYVVLGLGVWSAVKGTNFNSDYWNMGVQGAMFQMIAHGVSSAGMFFMVGVLYDRVHHRNLNEFGGLFGKMPVYTALAIGIFFAGLGLPGLCGFIGEVLVVLSVWEFSYVLAIISASVVIITAAYILWAIQRVYLGAEYKGPHEEELRPISSRELAIAIPLFVFAILLGVFPHHVPGTNIPSVLQYLEKTVERQTNDLADWTKRVAVPLEPLPSEDESDDDDDSDDASGLSNNAFENPLENSASDAENHIATAQLNKTGRQERTGP